MSTNTGGPAFPFGTAFAGMTLRDYFAAKAMHAIALAVIPTGALEEPDSAFPFAKAAYKMADAMLKAREQ